MVIDYGGRTIPWYDPVPIGARNYIREEMPVAPSQDEIQKYIAQEEYYQSKLREGSGWLNDTLGSLSPIKIAAMVAATVSGNPELIPVIAGADTAIQGGSVEDVLKSAAIAAATQAIGGEIKDFVGGLGGADISLPSETPYIDLPDGEFLLTPNVVTPDVSTLTDDATRLAQMLKEFENPTELTGPTIDVADKVSIENPSVIDSQAPVMPSNLQDTAYLDPGLIDVAPENVTIGTPDTPTYYDASPTFPVLNVSPEYDPSAYLPTNLGGTQDLGGFNNILTNLGTNVGGGTQDLGGLDVPFNTTTPTDLSAGELTVTGDRPYVPFEENFPLPYEPYEDNYPTQGDETVDPTDTQLPKIKLGNLLKSTSAINTRLNTAQNMQQQSNLANMLRGTQMPQSLLPSIYKQANPFNFGQQALPVQDTNALVKLLRTA